MSGERRRIRSRVGTPARCAMSNIIGIGWLAVVVIGLGGCSDVEQEQQPDRPVAISFAEQERRISEVEQISKLGGPEAVALLIELARSPHEDGQVRMAAITALGELGDTAAVEPLIEILERDLEDRTGIWAAAIPVLGQLGDPRATPILVRTLEDRDEYWLGRSMGAEALGAIGDPEAVDPLLAATQYGDTRETALVALERMGVQKK